MAISPLSAARTMCRVRGWQLSNLELQKLLYLAELTAIGRSGGLDPLINGSFQAWDFGPVQPEVYHRAKAFGIKPVRDVFTIAGYASGRELAIIEEVADFFSSYSPGELVAITHADGGAWSDTYIPGVKGIVIPREAIYREYMRRA